jgi:hypothetical protein
MERDSDGEVSLHRVRRIVEVRVEAANELLDNGWTLHEIFFGSESDFRPYYILLCTGEITCRKCGAPAKIEVLDAGERIRFICTRECSWSGGSTRLPRSID